MVILIPELSDIIAELFMLHDLLPGRVVLKKLLCAGLEHISLIKAICVGVKQVSTPYKILSQLLGNLNRRHLVDATRAIGFLVIFVIKRLASLCAHMKANVNHDIKAHSEEESKRYLSRVTFCVQFCCM